MESFPTQQNNIINTSHKKIIVNHLLHDAILLPYLFFFLGKTETVFSDLIWLLTG